MSEDLKPCPFCGGSPRTYESGGAFHISCGDCDFIICSLHESSNAIDRWNSRAVVTAPLTPDRTLLAQAKDNADLRARLEALRVEMDAVIQRGEDAAALALQEAESARDKELVAEQREKVLRKALQSAGACFSRIYAQTCTSGADYGFPHVAKWSQEEAVSIIAALAPSPEPPE